MFEEILVLIIGWVLWGFIKLAVVASWGLLKLLGIACLSSHFQSCSSVYWL